MLPPIAISLSDSNVLGNLLCLGFCWGFRHLPEQFGVFVWQIIRQLDAARKHICTGSPGGCCSHTYLVAPGDPIYTPPPKIRVKLDENPNLISSFGIVRRTCAIRLSLQLIASFSLDLPSTSIPMVADSFELKFRMRTGPRARSAHAGAIAKFVFALAVVGMSYFFGKFAVAEEITFSRPDIDTSILVAADSITRWQSGSYEVLYLRGGVKIRQQQMQAVAGEAILWVEIPVDAESDVHKVIAYLEDQVVIDLPRSGVVHAQTGVATDRIVDERWLGRFFTRQTVDLSRLAEPLGTGREPEIYARAQSALAAGAESSVQTVSFVKPQGQLVVSPQTGALQFVEPASQSQIQSSSSYLPSTNQVWQPEGAPTNLSNAAGPISSTAPVSGFTQQSPGSPFSVQITARDSSSDLNIKSFSNPQNPNERVSVGVGGFRIAINSSALDALESFRTDQDRQVNILADNLVQWDVTRADGTQSRQFYVEGNIVFSKDRRVIYAQKMFYDIDLQRGTILDTEILTPIPEYEGLVRLKADVVQQVDANNLEAYGAAITTSRLGVPRYWLQSENLSLTQRPVGATDPWTFAPLIDPGDWRSSD